MLKRIREAKFLLLGMAESRLLTLVTEEYNTFAEARIKSNVSNLKLN